MGYDKTNRGRFCSLCGVRFCTKHSQAFGVRMYAPLVEPVRRLVAGRYGWAVHRFPIKGGISIHQAVNRSLSESLAAPSTLLNRLTRKDA